MVSRRIHLLTKGYYDGVLDFKYKTRFSRLREEYLLTVIEQEEIKKLFHLRATVDATLLAAIKTPEAMKQAFVAYDAYRELALPYLAKKDNIDDDKSLKQMKKIHEMNKQVFEAMRKSKSETKDK